MIKTIAITIAILGLTSPVMAQQISWVQGPQSLRLAQPKSLAEQATDAMDNSEHSRAALLLDKAIAVEPNNPALKQQLYTALLVGGSEAAKGLPQYAITQLTRAIAIKPHVGAPWLALGKAHCALAERSPHRPIAVSHLRRCMQAHRKAIQLTDKLKPHYVQEFAQSLARISPAYSAQLFDLSSALFLGQDDRQGAMTSQWLKRQALR